MTHRIQIPQTNLSLCPIGMGTVSAGLRWSGQAADRLFDAYLELGGNLVDTAHVYSDWVPGEVARSERVVGDWLRRSGKREKIVLVTKGGHPDMAPPEPDIFANRCSRREMESDLHASLRQLGTDWIDLYFYHRDDTTIPVEEMIETMENFVRTGKIRYYGCSNWTPERMRQADAYCHRMGYRGFVADQSLLNVGLRYMKPMSDPTLAYTQGDAYRYHVETPGNLMMPYMSVCSGFFFALKKGGEAAVRDSNYYTEGNLRMARRLEEIQEAYGCTLTQAILGFLRTRDFPCVALYGANLPEHMADALGTLDIPFRAEDYRLED